LPLKFDSVKVARTVFKLVGRHGFWTGLLKYNWQGHSLTQSSFLFVLILLSHMCGSSRGSLLFYECFCRRKAAVVLRKVEEGLRFDCG